MGAPLSAWPWDNLSKLKYLLYAPLVARAFNLWGEKDAHNRWFHILAICVSRGLVHQLWYTYSSMLFLTNKYRVIKQGIDFKQIDREGNWDNFIILQAFMAVIACYYFSFTGDLPLFNYKGLIYTLILHVVVGENLYYWLHRMFHSDYFFRHYHSLHHQSVVSQPYTAEVASFLEHIVLALIIAIPMMGATWLGGASITMFYGYVLIFDFLRCMGHCNVEVMPLSLFQHIPILRYLVYTPSYHSLHHTEMNTNFCLFMPIFDAVGNTLNEKSWELHRRCRSGEGERVPDFVFLAHVVDVHASMHVPFVFRSCSSQPFTTRLLVLPAWPIAFIVMLFMWAWANTFIVSFYMLRDRLHQTWCIPRFGFQYFLPFSRDGINKHIEDAILTADKMGVKVLSLAALNKIIKPTRFLAGVLLHGNTVCEMLHSLGDQLDSIYVNEALNGGGALFVQKHPNLRVRVVHGNTLTAAVILDEIPKDVREVFLTGATSKLGRAIALYLCRRGIKVLMLTLSSERFHAIQKEAPTECQKFLVQVTKYQAAQNCKTWIVGKWITPREQRWAPTGAHFHQFVVPPILGIRKDCTYGDLAAMRLSDDVEGLGYCEYTMGRGIVHACHAGGVVHHLEGWDHHEVGAIDVDRIDLVWNSALKLGLRPVKRNINAQVASPVIDYKDHKQPVS